MVRLATTGLSLLLTLLLGSWAMAQTQPSTGNQAVILQYHHINSKTPRSTSVTREEFRMHMEFLKANGFTIRPLPEVLTAIKAGTPLPDKTAAITFDDAYASVYDAAFPLLKDYGWPFTVFVPTGLVGSSAGLYASWEQLREMGKAGATLANHSVSHPYFLDRRQFKSDVEWLAWVEQEITQAEETLLKETGQNHKIHAYPYGEYNPAIEALITRLGYIGLGQHSGPINATSSFTALPRFPFSGVYTPLKSFGPKALSLAFNVAIEPPVDPITSKQNPEVVLDFDGSYRFDAMTCYANDKLMKIEVIDAATQKYRLTNATPSKNRRFRYNCTAPGRDGRYYWFSVPWLNPAIPDG
jgi:poly-beta-1,6-N-acetyl-D-glucosamine N-deacetylase